MMDLCDRAGERGRDERCEGEGGLPPTVDTALLSGRKLRTGEGGLPPTIEPATDSGLPPTTEPATETEPGEDKMSVGNYKMLQLVLGTYSLQHITTS